MFDVTSLIARTNVEARPYQERIVTKVVDLFQVKQLRSALIESPTGSGKTVMALLAAKAMYEAGFKIGWVAMRKHLLQQTERENQAKGICVPLTYISMFDKSPPSGLDMLIVDEAQHDAAASMGHIHAKVAPKYILGLSATPFRADRVKLCFDTVIKDAGIPTLIREGYLSSYHHYTIPKWEVEEVVARYVAEPERWGKSIMYFHRMAQAHEAVRLLQEYGYPAEAVTGASDEEAQIKAFASGELKVLTNCMKLTEGFDCPDLKTVWCKPSCKSVTIQMAGRVLRKHPDHPYKQIVQCMKTPYPFGKTALASLQHSLVDGQWRTLTVNPHIEKMGQRMTRVLANIETTMPAFIKKNSERGRRRLRIREGPTADNERRIYDHD
jgi:superfamily II DNA or RNA helicase